MSDTIERELGWDDEIEKDGSEYEVLPEGDYDFEVVAFERARHPGSAKLPVCNKAVVSLEIRSDTGAGFIKHNIFLHSKTEGLISAFFTAIGQKKKGEKLKMNWGAVIGSTGRCKVGIHTWDKDDGSKGTSNEIKKFYPKEESTPASPATGFVPGKF